VRVKIMPGHFSLAMVRAKAEVFAGTPVIGLRESVIGGLPRFVKTATDLAVAATALVILPPLMAAIALMIRLDSRGPVIPRQKRAGENGHLFDRYTFRTMVPEAERLQTEVIIETEAAQVVRRRRDDPRLTRAGQFLRRCSLDELPQLANVLQGSLSIVGPRSEMPWLVDKCEPWQRKRFAVPQGMTGWWPIYGRSDKPKHLNTDGDLYSGYTYSLSLGLWILLQTPLAAIKGTGVFQGRAYTDLGWEILSHRQEPRFLTNPVPPIHTDSPRTCGCAQVSPDSLAAVKDSLSSAR
jgi:lipopolysaccharide/colanic/teichoic acid biosynthesis glycosyltransferase